MAKVLTNNENVSIGAFKFPDRKKVCLCVEKGNQCTIYGTFNSESGATEFMNELGKLVGAKIEE